MKTIHQPDARADLIRRINTLTPQSLRRWGRMSVDQMVWHVNGMLRISIGEQTFVPQESLLRRTVVRYFAFHMPWPKGGTPTASEVKAAGSYDFEQERSLFFDLVERVAARDLAIAWPRHPAFGAMTGLDWSRLQQIHVDHHLKQFGV